MNVISLRSLKVFGPVVVLGVSLLAGCAATNGTAASSAAAARPLAAEAPAPGNHTICSGGYASRFPERQATGRVCRESLSLRNVY